MRTIKLIFTLIISLLASTTILAAQNLPTPATVTENLNSIVAVVNNEVITQSDLDSAVAAAKKQMPAKEAANIDNQQLENSLLQQLINQKLILQIAERDNIKVNDKQLSAAIDNIAKANHMSVKQLQDKINSQGMSFEDYKNQLKNEILIHQVQMQAVGHTINISPEDLSTFTNKIKAQIAANVNYHVLDMLLPNNDFKQAAAAASQWKKGKNPQSANTTDLGWQTANTLPNIFVDQLQKMTVGDIAGPIKAPNGYHVIKLVAIKNNAQKMPSEAQIKNMLFQTKLQKAAEKWLKKLRDSAYIKVN